MDSEKAAENVELILSALGVYEAEINGVRISDYVLAPGWTSYEHRLQYQEYDITDMVREKENILTVTVGKGWYRSRMADWADKEEAARRQEQPCGLIAELRITYSDGEKEVLSSDGSWEYGESPVRFSEIYDGERYDACFQTGNWKKAVPLCGNKEILIPQEGPVIREMERVKAKSILQTPKGETVIDFGQEIAGYVEFTVDAKAGEAVHILHGEVLDSERNFYRENYRSAKAEITYICREGSQTWHPGLTFFGFRYIKLDAFPGNIRNVKEDQFTAIAVYSDMKRTGEFICSDPLLNRLVSNVFWGQKSNFIDVPTDCPQRDECLGWTGFLGTPLILHALSNYGHTDLAYSLLLRREYPSWLYPVEKGATTIWEHWDGIRPDGKFWSADMNSFNHYSYGAAADWIYEVAAGITPEEDAPGFQRVRIEPHPDERLAWLKASIQTRNGVVSSGWSCEADRVRYEITAEMPARIVIDGKTENVEPGKYTFWGSI